MNEQRDKLSIRQPNVITNARYDYTKVEKNVIYHAIIALQDSMNGNVAPDLFDKHLAVTIPYNVLKRWDLNDNISRDLKNAVRSLRKKDFDIKTTDGWIDTGFIVFAEYSEKKGLYLEVSKALVPALMELKRNFTAYNAVVALSLRSKYAQRFYELCCRWRDTGWFEFTPDSLNDILKSRMSTGQLRERVIDTAKGELDNMFNKSHSDVTFEVEDFRSGRGRGGGLQKWRFRVISREKEDKKRELESEDYRYVVEFLKGAWPGRIDLVNTAAEQILASNCVLLVADRIQKIEPRKIKNMGGYLRNILRDEFGVQFKG